MDHYDKNGWPEQLTITPSSSGHRNIEEDNSSVPGVDEVRSIPSVHANPSDNSQQGGGNAAMTNQTPNLQEIVQAVLQAFETTQTDTSSRGVASTKVKDTDPTCLRTVKHCLSKLEPNKIYCQINSNFCRKRGRERDYLDRPDYQHFKNVPNSRGGAGIGGREPAVRTRFRLVQSTAS
jgi:hypothetical protein